MGKAEDKVTSKITELVDRAGELKERVDSRIKKCSDEVAKDNGEITEIEDKLLKAGKKMGHPILYGERFEAVLSPSTSSFIDPEKFHARMKKNKKMKAFWEYVKVSIGDCKKYLGAAFLEGLIEIETTPYAKIKIKRKK